MKINKETTGVRLTITMDSDEWSKLCSDYHKFQDAEDNEDEIDYPEVWRLVTGIVNAQ